MSTRRPKPEPSRRGLLNAALAICLAGPLATAGAAGPAVAPIAPIAPVATAAPASPEGAAELARARAEMKRAQAELKRAADEMARISREQNLSNPKAFAYEFAADPDRAMLGVTITDGAEVDGRAAGVLITGVTPGSGADKAGLKTGDLLLVANGVGLAAVDQTPPSKRLWSVMEPLKPGDTVTLDYRRDGQRASARVIATRPIEAIAPEAMMSWHEDHAVNAVIPPLPPLAPMPGAWPDRDPGASLQLARLDDELGAYFQTREGVLVLRAPRGGTLALRSGDVISRINDRAVSSPATAWAEIAGAADGVLKIDVLRHGKPLALRGRLGADPE